MLETWKPVLRILPRLNIEVECEIAMQRCVCFLENIESYWGCGLNAPTPIPCATTTGPSTTVVHQTEAAGTQSLYSILQNQINCPQELSKGTRNPKKEVYLQMKVK